MAYTSRSATTTELKEAKGPAAARHGFTIKAPVGAADAGTIREYRCLCRFIVASAAEMFPRHGRLIVFEQRGTDGRHRKVPRGSSPRAMSSRPS